MAIIVLGLWSTFATIAGDGCLADKSCLQTSDGLNNTVTASDSEGDVRQLNIDEQLLNDRRYQQVIGTAEIFDGPDGNVVSILPEGFNFVTVLEVQNGWTQINAEQWVKSEQLKDVNSGISRFSGVLLPEEPLPYPIAWALINFYPSRMPGGKPSSENPLIWHYSRVYIYNSAEVKGDTWYQIGADQWVQQRHIARALPIRRPAQVDTERWISIDLYEQVAVAFENETPVFATLISSGQSAWATKEGLFHIYFRRPRKDMTGGQPGDGYYYIEEVPWTMFFDEGRALHGAYWHDGFGYRRSHGCINLSITDAHWLYEWVAESLGSRTSRDIEVGPAVYIFSSGEYQ